MIHIFVFGWAMEYVFFLFGAMERSTIVQIAKHRLACPTLGLTAVSPGFVLVAHFSQRRLPAQRGVIVAAILQLLIIALNAVSRHRVQNTEIIRCGDVSKSPVNLHWSHMILYFALLLFGLGVAAWMVAKIAAIGRKNAAAS